MTDFHNAPQVVVGLAADRPDADSIAEHTVYVSHDTGARDVVHEGAWHPAAGGGGPVSFVEATEITTPAAPAAGHQRLFVDSTDHLAKMLDSASGITRLGSAISVGTYNQGAGHTVSGADSSPQPVPMDSIGRASPDVTFTIGDDHVTLQSAGVYLVVAELTNDNADGLPFTSGWIRAGTSGPGKFFQGDVVQGPAGSDAGFTVGLGLFAVTSPQAVTLLANNATGADMVMGGGLLVIRLL